MFPFSQEQIFKYYLENTSGSEAEQRLINCKRYTPWMAK
jgi:hypothetical protein